MKQIRKIDINLYILLQTLINFDSTCFSVEVQDKLKEFIQYIDGVLFAECDPDYDCIKQEWFVVDTLEK